MVRELSDGDFAGLIADLVRNGDTWGTRGDDGRWSLPGAQAKVALFRTADGRWAVPNDSTSTTHILKPAVPPCTDHHVNEFMTMAAARELGLPVADDFLERTESGDVVFVSERYDRQRIDGRWHRLHQEDLCQALSVPPANKYQVDGGPGVGKIAQLFAGLPESEDRRLNGERFYDALVFALASLGTDAHAKNYSLLLRGERATLAPLYDLGSHAPHPFGGGVPQLAMSIGGEYKVSRIGSLGFLAEGRRLGIDRERAETRFAEITTGVVAAYRRAGELAHDVLGAHPFIDTMIGAIDEYAAGRGWTQSSRLAGRET